MEKRLNSILEREMSRREFVVTIGLGLASVAGLSSILRILGAKGRAQKSQIGGYGSSAYGR